MIKYKACFLYEPRIVETDIDNETDLYVWVDEQRIAKTTKRYKFFDTKEDAKNFLISFFEKVESECKRKYIISMNYVSMAKNL